MAKLKLNPSPGVAVPPPMRRLNVATKLAILEPGSRSSMMNEPCLPVSAGGQHQDPAIPHTAVDGSCGITVNAGARGHGAVVEVGGETAATSDAREGEKTTSRQDYKPG